MKKKKEKNINLDNTYKDKVNKEIQSMKDKYEKISLELDDIIKEKGEKIKSY